MRKKFHLNLILVIVLILMIAIPNYSNAASASEIVKADLSKQTMSTLKDWHTQLNNRA